MTGTLPAGILLLSMPSPPCRRNLVEEVDAAYMRTCLYHKSSHPLCPVFKLGYVVQESGQNFSTLAEKVWCQANEEGWVLESAGQRRLFSPRSCPPRASGMG